MEPPTSTILLVEDDVPTREFLGENLRADGYDTLAADSVREGLRLLAAKLPDLAVVDIGLPDATGYELLRTVRHADGVATGIDPQTPVVMLSGHADDVARVRALDHGADDFVPKPYSYPELRGRIAAVLRRATGALGPAPLQVGALRIDPTTREVRVGGERIDLPGKEYALLRALASNPSRVFTKRELLRAVWGYADGASTRTLDTHACRLRHRLRCHGDGFVVTEWGVGYRLVEGAVGA